MWAPSPPHTHVPITEQTLNFIENLKSSNRKSRHYYTSINAHTK